MTDFFAGVYETLWGWLLYSEDYYEVYNVLYDSGGYVLIGLIPIIIPLIIMALFYFVWKYPYARFFHWAIALFAGASLLTAVLTWFLTDWQLYASEDVAGRLTSDELFKNFFILLKVKFALVNGMIAVVWGFVCSLFLKRGSKHYMHLPF